MEKHLSYKVFLQKEPEGGYTATVPALQGCVTYGDNVEHAMEMAKEAIELYLESLAAHGDEIPSDDNKLEYTITLAAGA
jgi:antitoxin HicB